MGSQAGAWEPANPALKGTRGYALACFPLLPSARAPLARALGNLYPLFSSLQYGNIYQLVRYAK